MTSTDRDITDEVATMKLKPAQSLFSTLLLAHHTVASDANAMFLRDLAVTLPGRWPERLPREGALTERFPGLRAEAMRQHIEWCREAMAEEREIAEEDGWTPADGGSTAKYLAKMAADIRLQEEELAAL